MDSDTYLGDGLYAAFDGWQIELYASNGRNKTNVVYLEPGVLAAFLRYVESLRKQNSANGVRRTGATNDTEEK
jgi:hypothetical protein